MQNDIQRQIHSAILLVLRPIARALLRGGVGYREFSEIAKTAFVDIATKDYGLRGRPTNISRVAVMTGLTRKEVRRIRGSDELSLRDLDVKHTPIAQILHRWHTDNDFLTPDGEPLPLSADGKEKSFSSLVKKYGGDVPPGAMRTELERINAIEVREDGFLLPTKRVAYNSDLHDKLKGGLTTILFPAALNLDHNLKIADESDRWANLVTHTRYLRVGDRGRYKRIAQDRINEFANLMDDMQAGYESLYEGEDENSDADGLTLGVGIFYFEEDKTESDIFD
ncbi:MAG: DUF6502 family protein [Woeseiaceae bacterium]